MGWVINGVPPDHFENITIYDIDTVEAFGKFYDLNAAQASVQYVLFIMKIEQYSALLWTSPVRNN